MLKNSRLGRSDRKIFPAQPTVNDFNDFLEAARAGKGRWIDFSWRATGGMVFTVSVQCREGLRLPKWRLYEGDEGRSLVLEHQSCDVPLIFNVVASRTGMSECFDTAEGAASMVQQHFGATGINYDPYSFSRQDNSAPFVALDGLDQKEIGSQAMPDAPVGGENEEGEDLLQSTNEANTDNFAYPPQLICPQTEILTYPGLLFILGHEYERLKRAKAPLSLVIISVDPALDRASEANNSEASITKFIPHFVAAQRKSDTLAHYKENQLALILPATALTGAKIAARRLLKAQSAAEDPAPRSQRLNCAIVDVINDAPSLKMVLAAVDATSWVGRRSGAEVFAYRDMLLNLNEPEQTSYLKRQILTDSKDSEATDIVAQLILEISSEKTGAFTAAAGHYFFEHYYHRALREQRSFTMLRLDIQLVSLKGATNAPQDRVPSMKEVIQYISRLKRNTDVIAEDGAGGIILLLPDTPLSGARTMALRMKSIISSELALIVRPAAHLSFQLTVCDALKNYPQFEFEEV